MIVNGVRMSIAFHIQRPEPNDHINVVNIQSLLGFRLRRKEVWRVRPNCLRSEYCLKGLFYHGYIIM